CAARTLQACSCSSRRRSSAVLFPLVMINLTTSASDGKIIANQLQRDGRLADVPLLCLSSRCFGPSLYLRPYLARLQFPGGPGKDRPAFARGGPAALWQRVKTIRSDLCTLGQSAGF